MKDIASSAIRENDTKQRQGLEEQHKASPSFKQNKHTGALKQTAQSTPSPNQLPIRQNPVPSPFKSPQNHLKWKSKYITHSSLLNTRHAIVVRLATTESRQRSERILKYHTIVHDQQTDTTVSLSRQSTNSTPRKSYPTIRWIPIMAAICTMQQTDLKTEEIVQTQQKVHPTKTPILQDIRQIADT